MARPKTLADSPAPLVGEPSSVNTAARLPRTFTLRSETGMNDRGLSASLDRAERALARIERALTDRREAAGRDEQLRARVREAVAELDQLIREAADA